MIHLITSANRSLFEDELLEFRRINRDDVAADAAWGTIARAGGIGDAWFDGDDAVYIVGIEGGRVYGGARLIPTSKPHLLSDVFPHLASVRAVPRDPTIYEWTPMLADAAQRADRDSRPAIGAVMCAVLEYCLGEGIDALSGIIDAWSLPRFHDMGWTVHPLGLPEQIGRDWVLAVTMPIEASTLEATRAFYGIDEAVLTPRGLRPATTWEIVV